MKRQEVYIDVRTDTSETMEHMAAHVGQALDCTFTRGEFQRRRAQVAYALGLKLSLVRVRGTGRKKVAKLVGDVAEDGFLYAPDGSDQVEYDRVDISAYIVDLLTIRTGLHWYRPTTEDYAAEQKEAGAYDDWLGGAGPQTTIDEEKEFPDR
nr:hypothetical protein [Kibdelosporangium sp. MJ126-NF4]